MLFDFVDYYATGDKFVMAKNIFVVVPTIREEHIKFFLKKWQKHFLNCEVIVVEDNPSKTFSLPDWTEHYSWEDIDRELKDDSWIIPRKSPAIRSFGFLKALELGAEIIISLDDDCLPEKGFKGNFVDKIVQNLNRHWDDDGWWTTLKSEELFPRGYPYLIRTRKQSTIAHHGLWSNIPDLDGQTQKNNPDFRTKPFKKVEKVPKGKYFPMSSMNLAFKRQALVAFYMLLMGEDRKGKKWGYDRFDDIWAGIFLKKICDHLGLAISSGYPSIRHDRASNLNENIKKEKNGIKDNEWLWEYIDKLYLTSNNLIDSYIEIAHHIKKKRGYWDKLAKAMVIWVGYINNYEKRQKSFDT